jgi:predicted Fe-Mo cluster-binding NifX family protein
MLVAVASKSGMAIDEHFGHAKVFHIYRLDAQGCHHQEDREVDNYCHGPAGSHGEDSDESQSENQNENQSETKSTMQKILETIADCQAVFVVKAGDGPIEKLAARGIEAVSEYAWEDIEASLSQYYQKHAPQSDGQGAVSS